MEIVLNFPGINLLISLRSQKHDKSELKDINVQVITESINLKEEQLLLQNMVTQVIVGSWNGTLEAIKKNRHQDERMSDPHHNIMQATIS